MFHYKSTEATVVFIIDWGYFAILKLYTNTVLLVFFPLSLEICTMSQEETEVLG